MTDRSFRVMSALVFVVLAFASTGCMGSLGSEPVTPETLGPRAVGVTTMRVEDEARDRDLTVEVWYPAAQKSSSPPVVYSVAAMGTTVARLRSIAGAHRDAAPFRDDGPRPVVLLSHGAGSSRFANTSLAEVLASHGYIVAAPDHSGHTMSNHVWGIDNEERAQSAFDRPLDLSRVLDALGERSKGKSFVLKGLVDTSRVAVAGHSFGGAAALGLVGAQFDIERQRRECERTPDDRRCAMLSVFGKGAYRYHDDRVRAALLITPAGFDLYRADGIAKVEVPALVVGAVGDNTTPHKEYSKPIYESLEKPHYLLELERAGHLTATDVCAIVDSVGFLATLGDDPRATDGCGERFIPSADALERVSRAAVPFLALHLLGQTAAKTELEIALAPPGSKTRVAGINTKPSVASLAPKKAADAAAATN